MRPVLEVADIFRRHGEAFRVAQGGRLLPDQRRVMAAIEACRTATLGGHVEQCDDCGQVRIAYNSCRDRHCPKCQGLARAQWLADRQADLLPVQYFHVVFTVPAPVAAIALQNKAIVYDILLKAAAETIRRIGADPRHLGAETGMIAILHTWGQTLMHHPHAHCLVPGGGLAADGRWIDCRPGFFLPVRVLSRLYRRLFLEHLQAAFDAAKLEFFGHLAHLASPAAFVRHLNVLRKLEWIVYAKSKVMTLEADEFIRRFLLHVLPKGFRRIRHFGFLANACRAAKLALIRSALQAPVPPPIVDPADYRERFAVLTGHRIDLCPICGGRMIEIGLYPRSPSPRRSAP